MNFTLAIIGYFANSYYRYLWHEFIIKIFLGLIAKIMGLLGTVSDIQIWKI